jgi:glutathione S-transferase
LRSGAGTGKLRPGEHQMPMRLYCSLTSPYARKVRVLARELGLADAIEEVLVDPHSSPADLLNVNPLSKVPTLATERGETLPDSGLIAEYLLTRGRGLAALPRGGQRWVLLRRLQLADGVIDAAVSMVMEKRRPPEFVYQGTLDRQTAAINRTLDSLDAEAGELTHEGPIRTVEVSAGVALAYLDFRQPQLNWRSGRDRLASWHFAVSQRPSMQQTEPPKS